METMPAAMGSGLDTNESCPNPDLSRTLGFHIAAIYGLPSPLNADLPLRSPV